MKASLNGASAFASILDECIKKQEKAPPSACSRTESSEDILVDVHLSIAATRHADLNKHPIKVDDAVRSAILIPGTRDVRPDFGTNF